VTRAQLLAALLAVAVAVWVVDLVRRRKLSEEYSLLSLVAMAGVLALAFFTKAVTWITHRFGALYETSVIFFFGLVFAFLALVWYATKLTALTQEVRRLAQETALLRLRLERAEGDRPGRGRSGGAEGAGRA
jgi:MFS family permease